MSKQIHISQKDTQDTLDLTQEIIDKCPKRIVGLPDTKKAAECLEEQLSQFCDETHLDPFDVWPKSFLSFLKAMAITYPIATLLFFLGDVTEFVGLGLLTLTAFLGFSQFVFYFSLFDRFFKKEKGYNVSGVIEPKGEIKQQIIIGGHHDAVYEFNFLRPKVQYYYGPIILSGTIIFLGSWFVAIADLIYYLVNAQHVSWFGNFRYFMLIGLIFVIPFYFFEGKRITPGAGDNLVASVIAVKLGRFIKELEEKDGVDLKHTRLVLLSTDAEEAGLRGAKAYVKKYKKQLKEIPTHVINVDSIYEKENLQILTSDINGMQPLNKDLVRDLKNVSDELGYDIKAVPFKFFGGATDSGAYARKRISATTIIAMSTDTFRRDLYYHTVEDKVENIEPGSVEACLNILVNFVLKKDEEVWKNS